MMDVIGHKVPVLWNIVKLLQCDLQIFTFLVKYLITPYCELIIAEPSQAGQMSDSMRDDPSVIKVRGLPYDTSPIDLCRFFKDCEINGGPNGE